jgi:hypothetical protein
MPVDGDFESELQDQEVESADDLPAGIDLEELAKKVFDLLLQELEVENDRTGKKLTR